MAFTRATAERIVGEAAQTAGQKVQTITSETGLDAVLRAFEEMPPSAYLAAMAAAIAVSVGLMAGRDRARHWALFVGLWAPTIVNLGLYSRLRRI